MMLAGVRNGLSNKALAFVVSFALVASLVPIYVLATPQEAQAVSKVSLVVSRATTGKLTVKKGSTYKLQVKATKGSKVTYKSSKPSVASVTKKGVVKAKKTGKTTITVVAKKGKSKAVKKIKVTVVKPSKYKRVKSITVKPASKTLEVGKAITIKTTFKPAKASNKNVAYKSSNTKVLAVDAKGRVTAKKPGKAKVTVTSCDNAKVKKSVTITVKANSSSGQGSGDSTEQTVSVESVSTTMAENILLVGETSAVQVTVKPAKATNKKLTYSSSDSRIASVDSQGVVTAKRVGTAKITVTSVDNSKALSFVVVHVVQAESDESETLDQVGVEEIDPSHENKIEYSSDAVVVKNASYKLNEDGSVTVDPSQLPSGLSSDDVVVFEPTNENPDGATVKVDDDGAYDGSLSGGMPELNEVYDSIDLETVGVVAADGFVPEPDVEVINVEEGSASKRNASDIAPLSVDAGGEITSTFTLKYKGLKFSITPTGTLKYNYDLWGINKFYLSVKVDESLKMGSSLSSIFGHDSISKKLGAVTFVTSVPGLQVEGSLWLHLEADGNVSFSLEASQEIGLKYQKGNGWSPVYDGYCRPKLSMSAELNAGLDFVGTVKLCAIEVADPSIEGRFTLGVGSGGTKTRPTGLVCSDLKLKFAPSVSVGKHDSLLKKLGLSYSMNLGSKEIKKWHLENGRLIDKCTYKANKKAYETSESLLGGQDLLLPQPDPNKLVVQGSDAVYDEDGNVRTCFIVPEGYYIRFVPTPGTSPTGATGWAVTGFKYSCSLGGSKLATIRYYETAFDGTITSDTGVTSSISFGAPSPSFPFEQDAWNYRTRTLEVRDGWVEIERIDTYYSNPHPIIEIGKILA